MARWANVGGWSQKSVTRRVSFISIISVLALLFGCSDNAESQGQGAGAGAGQQGGQKQAMPVGFIRLTPEKIDYTQKLPGRVVSYRVAEIRPQVSGIIQARLFEEGSLVEEGDQLYQIDPERYQANLESAQADLESARASQANAQALVNRFDGLVKKKVLSEQEYDDAKTQLKQSQASVSQAEAAVKTARINLTYTKVYAPISGFIGPSRVTKGALVTQQQQEPLAIIRQLDPVYVDLSQSVGDAQKLKARLIESRIQRKQNTDFQVSLFFSESGEPYPHKGRLDATDLAVDEQTGAIRIRSVFPNPDSQLLPGLFVRASIEDLASSKALVVPQKSVRIGNGGTKHVWVVGSGNKAQQRQVETGVAFKDKWVIESGLSEGDRVIVEGTMNLQPGAPIKPTDLANKKKAGEQTQPNGSADTAAQSGGR